MLDPISQARLAHSCTEAALGYATAAGAAYAQMIDHALSGWRSAIEAALPSEPESEPRSWYRHPDAPVRRPADPASLPLWGAMSLPAVWLAPWQAMAPHLMAPWQPSRAQSEVLSLMWAAPWRTDVPPMAWPMALWMVAAGMPQSVAVPTAKANLAAMDATQTAVAVVEQAFASYRSDGGHAVAQVIGPTRTLGALLLAMPFGAGALQPWLGTFPLGA